MRCVFLALLLLTGTARADGPCCPAGIRHSSSFELFDLAATVARVEITSTAPVLAFTTITTFKGEEPKKLVVRANAPCDPQPKQGDKALVFLAADGTFVGGFAFHGYIAKPGDDLIERLDTWSRATTPETRAASIVDTIESGLDMAEPAVRFVADTPDVINAITLAQRERIALSLTKLDDSSMAPLVLWRLHLPNLAKRIPKRMFFRKRALELAKHDFTHITKPRDLANVLATVRIGSSARGAAAYERCERLLNRRPLTFSSQLEYVQSMDSPAWRRMTRICHRAD